jgi:predicted nucleotidyltransferase
MAKSKTVAAIKFFEERLIDENVNVSRIILFGSQAEGKASADSDVDLVLISKDFKNKNIFKRLEMIKKAEIATIKKFMIPIDIIMMTPEEFKRGTSLVSEYAKKGTVLLPAHSLE